MLARNAPLSRTPKGCGPIWFQGSDKQIHPICLLELKRVPIVPKEQMPNTVYIYIPVSTKPRYDLFYKASLLEAVGDIKKAYQEFAKNIRANLPECQAGKAI